jgi:hypothetical protein
MAASLLRAVHLGCGHLEGAWAGHNSTCIIIVPIPEMMKSKLREVTYPIQISEFPNGGAGFEPGSIDSQD